MSAYDDNLLDKTVDKILNGFGCIRELAKTKLWVASILGTLYVIMVIVGILVCFVSSLAAIITVLLGTLWCFSKIGCFIGFLYASVGGLVFFGSLFFTVFILVTLFIKKELQHENFFDED